MIGYAVRTKIKDTVHAYAGIPPPASNWITHQSYSRFADEALPAHLDHSRFKASSLK